MTVEIGQHSKQKIKCKISITVVAYEVYKIQVPDLHLVWINMKYWEKIKSAPQRIGKAFISEPLENHYIKLLTYITYPILATAILLNQSYINEINLFDVSMLSATLGGFLFLSGFISKEEEDLNNKFVRKVGSNFLLAAVCFAILGFTVPFLNTSSMFQIKVAHEIVSDFNLLLFFVSSSTFARGVTSLLSYLWITRKE